MCLKTKLPRSRKSAHCTLTIIPAHVTPFYHWFDKNILEKSFEPQALC